MPNSKPFPTGLLDDQIGFQLRMAQLAVFGDIIRELKTFNLRPVDLTLLSMIEADSTLRQSHIADKLKIARPNVVSLVDGLERAGLVERLPDGNDRRANRLRLTKKGRDIHAQAYKIREQHQARVLKVLESVDLENFSRGLKLLASMGSGQENE